MNDTTLKCPKCGAAIPLTESLAAPMVAAVRTEYEERLRLVKETAKSELDAHDKDIRAQEVLKAQQTVSDQLAAAKVAASNAVQDAEDLRSKLGDAQRAQAEAQRHSRELSDKEAAMDLTIERAISAGIDSARVTARREADEASKLKLAEAEQTIESMRVKLVEAQQKAEQGSQQLQGEVQELDLEQQLRARFPHDEIGEVAKGVKGADVTQTVVAPSGLVCGWMLYESKRTKNYSAAWLPKLREDGRAGKADILILVTTALPDGVDNFDIIDNVWVTSPRCALPLATALRTSLLYVNAVRQAQEGMKTKSEEVYSYVTGPQFRHRVEALVEAFTTLQEDLTAERKVAERQWAKRAAQIERVLTSTSGMFGDLQGIAGKALPAPVGLELGTGEVDV